MCGVWYRAASSVTAIVRRVAGEVDNLPLVDHDSSFWRRRHTFYFHAAIDNVVPGHIGEFEEADAWVLRI